MKKIKILVGIMLMLVTMASFWPQYIAVGQTITEAKQECEKNGGVFKVNQVYSDGTFSSTCVKSALNEKREECEKKGGRFEVYQTYSDGTFSAKCVTASTDPEKDPEKDPNKPDKKGTETNKESYGTESGTIKNEDCPNGVVTNFFGICLEVGEDGEAVFSILNVILQILTWGVGIAGTAGIVFTGIQYMTARDDMNQMAKAKSRLIQIVIGLAVYAVAWAFLQWLLPGGVFGS